MTTGVSTRLVDRRRTEMAVRHRRRRTILLGAIAGMAAAAGAWWVATGPFMTVSHVSVTGYTQPDQARVVDAIRVAARDGNALRLPASEIERAVAGAPWVASVDVSRDLPRGLKVHIVESTPRAVAVAADGGRYLLSADGRVLAGGAAVTPEHADALPQMHVTAASVGDHLPAGVERAPLTVAVSVSPDVSARVRDLRVQGGVLTGRLLSGPELRFGPPIDLHRKARALDALLANPDAQKDLAQARYVDLSSAGAPYLDGGPEAEKASTETQGSQSGPGQDSTEG